MNILTQKFEILRIIEQDSTGQLDLTDWKNASLTDAGCFLKYPILSGEPVDDFIKEIHLINPIRTIPIEPIPLKLNP
ncbi:MAG: hypothetical protein K9I36_16715 [Bacteroidia bacterium]|nr:hypothetical protein [Bacteroidia bacterium]